MNGHRLLSCISHVLRTEGVSFGHSGHLRNDICQNAYYANSFVKKLRILHVFYNGLLHALLNLQDLFIYAF